MKTKDEILAEIESRIDENFVTPKFGTNWKDYAEETFDKHRLIDIAWRQGRKAILLEAALEEALAASLNEKEAFVQGYKYFRSISDTGKNYPFDGIARMEAESRYEKWKESNSKPSDNKI